VTNANFCFDVWTIRQIATNDFGRAHWDSDDTINYLICDDTSTTDNVYNDDYSRIIESIVVDDDTTNDSNTIQDDTWNEYEGNDVSDDTTNRDTGEDFS
jgi:hypothetical protein